MLCMNSNPCFVVCTLWFNISTYEMNWTGLEWSGWWLFIKLIQTILFSLYWPSIVCLHQRCTMYMIVFVSAWAGASWHLAFGRHRVSPIPPVPPLVCLFALLFGLHSFNLFALDDGVTWSCVKIKSCNVTHNTAYILLFNCVAQWVISLKNHCIYSAICMRCKLSLFPLSLSHSMFDQCFG